MNCRDMKTAEDHQERKAANQTMHQTEARLLGRSLRVPRSFPCPHSFHLVNKVN
jgi:hypothetical protein